MPRFRTITVGDLREALEAYDEADKVIVTTDYGDHCHTPQALPLEGFIEETLIETSAYSNSGYRLKSVDDIDVDEDHMKYLVIR